MWPTHRWAELWAPVPRTARTRSTQALVPGARLQGGEGTAGRKRAPRYTELEGTPFCKPWAPPGTKAGVGGGGVQKAEVPCSLLDGPPRSGLGFLPYSGYSNDLGHVAG